MAEAVPELTCSALSRAAGESMVGTASTVRAWLLLEQPGPWGIDAVLESRLDGGFARELSERARQARVRVLLIRRFGRGASPARPHGFLAFTGPRVQFVEHRRLERHEDLLEVDLAALRRGERPGFGALVQRPLYLVCTNGRHDRCCATHGRPLAQALFAAYGQQVWECSHIGGDRFAGNLVCLPHGLYFGGLGPAEGVRTVELYERGRIDLPHYRGRCSQVPAVQAAEHFVREREGLDHVDDLRLERRDVLAGGEVAVTFSSPAGMRYEVRVGVRAAAEARPLTCRATQAAMPPEYALRDLQVRPAVSST